MEAVKNYENTVLNSVDSFIQIVSSEIHSFVENYKIEMVGKTIKCFQFSQGTVDIKFEDSQDGKKKFFLLFKSNKGEVKRVDFSKAIKLTFSEDGGRKLKFAEDLPSFEKGESGIVVELEAKTKTPSKEKEIEDAFNTISGASVPVQPYVGENLQTPVTSGPSDQVSPQIQPYVGMNSQIYAYVQSIKEAIDNWCKSIMAEYDAFILRAGSASATYFAGYDEYLKIVEKYYKELEMKLTASLNSEVAMGLSASLSNNFSAWSESFKSMISSDSASIESLRVSLMASLTSVQSGLMIFYGYIITDIQRYISMIEGYYQSSKVDESSQDVIHMTYSIQMNDEIKGQIDTMA